MIIRISAYKKSLHYDNLSIWTIEQRKSNKVFLLLKFFTRIDKLSQLKQLTPNKSTPRLFNVKQIERCLQHSNLNGKDLTLNWFSFKLNDFHHFSIFQLSSISLFCFLAIKKTFVSSICVLHSLNIRILTTECWNCLCLVYFWPDFPSKKRPTVKLDSEWRWRRGHWLLVNLFFRVVVFISM